MFTKSDQKNKHKIIRSKQLSIKETNNQETVQLSLDDSEVEISNVTLIERAEIQTFCKSFEEEKDQKKYYDEDCYFSDENKIDLF